MAIKYRKIPEKPPSARKRGAETTEVGLSVQQVNPVSSSKVQGIDHEKQEKNKKVQKQYQVQHLDSDFRKSLTSAHLTLNRFCSLSNTPASTGKNWSRGFNRAPGISITWLKLFTFACSLSSRAEVEKELTATSSLEDDAP